VTEVLSMPRVLLSLVTAALLAYATAVPAADLGVRPPDAAEAAGRPDLEPALSRYLALEMVRATFDVVPREDLKAQLEDKARRWGGVAPSPEEAADLDRQLLAEASYYLVSVSYVVQVGGAAFPDDKSEAVYANDTLVRIDSLQRRLADAIADGGDVTPILVEAEEIRSLTEGLTSVPEDLGIFTEHATILAEVMAELSEGTRT
jgi:hypothetical protein